MSTETDLTQHISVSHIIAIRTTKTMTTPIMNWQNQQQFFGAVIKVIARGHD